MTKHKFLVNFAILSSIIQLFIVSTYGGLFILMFYPIPGLHNTYEGIKIFSNNSFLRDLGSVVTVLMVITIVLSIVTVFFNFYLKRSSSAIAKRISIIMVIIPMLAVVYGLLLVVYSYNIDLTINPKSFQFDSQLYQSLFVATICPLINLGASICVAITKNKSVEVREFA